jgi:site-specific recombinase XerD
MRDRLSFKNFITHMGNKNLTSVDARLVDRYLNMRVQEVEKATVNIELRHLKAAFSKAVQWLYTETNPFKGIKPFTLPQTAPLFLTTEEITTLLSAIDKELLLEVVEFALNTGVRVGELVNIEWQDIDFDNQLVTVKQKKNFTTKSKRERTIPITDNVLTVLIGMTRTGSYVFANQLGQRRCSLRVSKSFKKYIRLCGLNEKYTFHTLRHTYASHLVQNGTSLYIVSKLLGHSDTKTTEIYAHLAPETYHEAVRVLDFGGSKNGKSREVVRDREGKKNSSERRVAGGLAIIS